ncbi:MAG: sugar ABC transporter permease [Defluviitaleaceae bacterium]|nr:sugar ABC transporter permease [Defluviitaleaceae bacterium]
MTAGTLERASIKPRKKKMRRSLYEEMSAYLLMLPYALLFTLFIAAPVAIAIGLSFTFYDIIQVPNYVGFLNYIILMTQDEIFLRYVLPNTFTFALMIGPGGFVLSFLIAWMLAQIQRIPRTLIALAMYAPSMAGGVFVAIVWRTVFSGNERGFINAALINWGFIVEPIQFLQDPTYLLPLMIFVTLWSSMGVGFLAILAGVLNYDPEIYEAAQLDGINNRFQEIVYITVPTMKPQMLFGAVMAIVNAFQMGQVGVLLSGSNPTPQYAGQLIFNHIEDFALMRFELGYAAAISVVLLIMVWGLSKVAYAMFSEK